MITRDMQMHDLCNYDHSCLQKQRNDFKVEGKDHHKYKEKKFGNTMMILKEKELVMFWTPRARIFPRSSL
jgi:hypothetical protein